MDDYHALERQSCSKIFRVPLFSTDLFEQVVQNCLDTCSKTDEVEYELTCHVDRLPRHIRESDFNKVRSVLAKWPGRVTDIRATLRQKRERGETFGSWRPWISIDLRQEPWENLPSPHLTVHSCGHDKRQLLSVMSPLIALYPIVEPPLRVHGLSFAREVIALCVDMRGFSAFCEMRRVESGYVSGVISTFLEAGTAAFQDYRPELIKTLGDGILAVWEIQGDRELVLQTCLVGLERIQHAYESMQIHQSFQLGIPDGIGAGVASSFASRLYRSADCVGRPLNVASRLCSECQAGGALFEFGIPGWKPIANAEKVTIDLKTFGQTAAWKISLRNQ